MTEGESMTEWGRREYEDYEELGRRLEVLREGLSAFQQQVVRMWDLGSGEAEDTRHLAHDAKVLEMITTLQRLHRRMALGFTADVGETDVPEGKPRVPPPFDREEL